MHKPVKHKKSLSIVSSTVASYSTHTLQQETSSFSSHSAQSAGSHTGVEEEEDYYLKFHSIAGWQTLLLLQFLPQMYIVILICLYLWYGMAICMVAFSFGCPINDIPRQTRSTFISLLHAGDVSYFIDWISMVIFKNVKWADINIKYRSRHGFVLFIELLSLIPYELVYGILVEPNMRVYNCLRMRYSLRLIRLFVYFKQSKEYIGNYGIVIYLLMYFGILVLVVITASGIYYISYCNGKCKYADLKVLSNIVYMTFISVSFCGVKMPINGYKHPVLDSPFTALTYYFLILLFETVFTCDVLQTLWPRFHMISMYRRCKNRIRLWQKTIEWRGYYMNFQRMLDEHSEISKVKLYGGSVAHQIKPLPTIIYKDLALDISWAALKHTHLFANEDIFFLRAVSERMVHKFLCPGEVVFKKNVNKSALVYIISGNVDVLSEEDGETPIVTFTSGTCLGECTLALGYPSVSTVVSKDTSDVAILERRELSQLAKLYPAQIKKIFWNVMHRCEGARTFRNLTEYQYRQSTSHERIGVLSLKWLKLTLRKLLYDDETDNQDMYSKEVMGEMEERIFCTRYLDLLVQSEYMGTTTNSTFIRAKFPFIFRPRSLLLKIWDYNILIHSLVLALMFPVAFVYLPATPFIYQVYHVYITCLWFFDIYVQTSTAVYTKFEQCTTVCQIFMYKLGQLSFLVDLFSALPLELVFSIMNGQFTRQDAIISSSNRLLKLYKLEQCFSNLQMMVKGIACIIYLKYFLYFMLLTYYAACFLCLLGNSDANQYRYANYLATFSADSVLENLYYAFVLAVAFARDICLFVFPYSVGFDTTVPLMALVVCFEIFLFYVIAHTTAIETMQSIDAHATNEFMRNVQVTMQVYDLEKLLRERIMNYIDLHMMAIGNSFLFESDLFSHLPKDLYIISKGIYPGLFLKSLQFFYHLDDKVLNRLAASCSIDLVLPNETFKPYDEMCYDIYILMDGFCSLKYSTGEERIVRSGEIFCVLEAAFGLRSLVHITSVTTCRILTLQYNVFKHILFKFPKEYHYLEETVKYFPYWEELERLTETKPRNTFSKSVYVSQSIKSLKQFPYGIKKRTQLYYEFNMGFPPWANFLQYFLLRMVFYSSGNFVFYWEVFHCSSVIIYIFILYLSLLIGTADLSWTIVRGVFEFFGLIDIYLRHHFTYYNEENVEVTHPYKTCIYYWKHAFLADFIAWLPLEWILANPTVQLTFWRLNRVLLLYRVFGLISYAVNRKTKLGGCWKLLTYVPIIICILNVLCYLILKCFCSRTEKGYECQHGTWLSLIETKSTLEIYMYNLLFISIIIVGSNNYVIMVYKPIAAHIFLVLGCIGFLIQMLFSAKIVAANLAINRDLCGYQEAMQHLLKFLNYLKIDKKLKQEMVKHYEYIWATIKGKRIVSTFSVFKSYFKVDLLYTIYGKTLRNSTIFQQPNENFFRCLLVEATHELYLKTGIIYQVNDVSGDIFILIKGKVEVVGADLNRLETLHVGSVFGNLDMVERSRRTLSAVTSGHVEVLKVDSMVFFKHLSKFPSMFKRFRQLTKFHVDYIREQDLMQINKGLDKYRVPSEVLKTIYQHQQDRFCHTQIFKRNIIIKIWEEYILNLMYLLNYIVEIFNISSATDFSIYYVLYFFDIIYILKIYMQLHTSYEDEYGRTIKIHGMILKRYKKQRFGLFFDLITLIPFELISFAFYYKPYYKRVLAVCRINRLPRILLTLIYCKKTMQKLNVNVIWVRFRYLFLWVFLVQLNFAFLLKLTHYSQNGNYWDEIMLFLHYLHAVIDASRHIASDYLDIEDNVFRLCLLNAIIIGTTILSLVFMAECCAIILLLTYTSSMYKNFVLYTKRFMEVENVSRPLVQRVENYIELLWSHHKGVQFPQLLEDAPRYLKEAVLYSMYGNHLMKHPVLMHCHKDLTRQICLYMKTLVFFPGDNVAYIGDIDNCMYFIQEGEIHALSEDTIYSEVVEFVLKGGDMFGLDQGLYPRCGHDYTYKCVMYTILVVLYRQDWIHLLDFFPASKRMIYDTSKAV